MLNTLRERLIDEIEIKTVKEKRSKYEITFLIRGMEIKEELTKTCPPGNQNYFVDTVIFGAMSKACINIGDYNEAGKWLDKIINYHHQR